MYRAASVAVLLALVVPRQTLGHSFAIYVSTPITPPADFWWLSPVSLVLLALSLLLTLRCLRVASWLESIVVSLVAVAAFAAVFCFIGWFSASSTTAPPPGLGPPSAVYWRWGSERLRSLFVSWNLTGTMVLLLAVCLVARLWLPSRRSKSPAVLAIPLVAYAALLVPFVATGALAHGWAGGYVMDAGRDQLVDINRACLRYARDNDGKLPVAQDIHELLAQIEQYIDRPRPRYGNPIYVHPAAWVFDKNPKAFIWNRKLSGQDAPELPIDDVQQIPVTCPYTGARLVFLDDLEDCP